MRLYDKTMNALHNSYPASGAGGQVAQPSQVHPTQKSYTVVADEIRRWIDDEEVTPGQKLPAERALMDTFQVSRTTIRRALSILSDEKLIERKQGRGRGTTVKARPPLVQLTRMDGFMPQLRANGVLVKSHVVSKTLEYSGPKQSAALGLKLHSPVFRIVRVRSVNHTPLLIEDSYFNVIDFPNLLDYDLTQSLYELLSGTFQHTATSKVETIIPAIPTSWERAQLEISESHPVLRIERTAFDQHGHAMEFSQDVMRSDIAHVQVTTSP